MLYRVSTKESSVTTVEEEQSGSQSLRSSEECKEPVDPQTYRAYREAFCCYVADELGKSIQHAYAYLQSYDFVRNTSKDNPRTGARLACSKGHYLMTKN